MPVTNKSMAEENQLYDDVRQIIDTRRQLLASLVNAEICMLHWQIGKRIKEDVLYNHRAEYGKQIVKNLSERLTAHFGKGWGYEKLKHCVRSAYLFSEEDIRYAMRTELTWTHLRALMSIVPDKKLISEKLKRAIAIAKAQYLKS